MKIFRNKITHEEVEIPEGWCPCPTCKGKGRLSMYDMGWRSFVHSPELAALRGCWECQAQGMIPCKGREGVSYATNGLS